MAFDYGIKQDPEQIREELLMLAGQYDQIWWTKKYPNKMDDLRDRKALMGFYAQTLTRLKLGLPDGVQHVFENPHRELREPIDGERRPMAPQFEQSGPWAPNRFRKASQKPWQESQTVQKEK